MVLQLSVSLLNVLHRCQLLCSLVLEPNYLPGLLKVAILIIKLAIWLVKRLCMVNPVSATLVNN